MKPDLSILKNLQKNIKGIDWICLIAGSQIFKVGEPDGVRSVWEILEKMKNMHQETPFFKGFISNEKEKIIFFVYDNVYLIIKGSPDVSISIIEDIIDVHSFLKGNKISPKEKNIAVVPFEFWKEIEREMTLKMGPVAGLLIEESLREISRTKDTISIRELPYFLELLCRELEDDELKNRLADILNRTLTSI